MNQEEFFKWNGHYEITIAIKGKYQQEITIEQLFKAFSQLLAEEKAQSMLKGMREGGE